MHLAVVVRRFRFTPVYSRRAPRLPSLERAPKVRNITGETLVFVFPANVVQNSTGVVTVSADTKVEVDLCQGVSGAFTYAVMAIGGGSPVLAKGESDPILIID